jgi:hypothetical protein
MRQLLFRFMEEPLPTAKRPPVPRTVELPLAGQKSSPVFRQRHLSFIEEASW